MAKSILRLLSEEESSRRVIMERLKNDLKLAQAQFDEAQQDWGDIMSAIFDLEKVINDRNIPAKLEKKVLNYVEASRERTSLLDLVDEARDKGEYPVKK